MAAMCSTSAQSRQTPFHSVPGRYVPTSSPSSFVGTMVTSPLRSALCFRRPGLITSMRVHLRHPIELHEIAKSEPCITLNISPQAD
jgi:hypothetical protein